MTKKLEAETRYTSSVRLRFIRRTNVETNYCRTVDELIRCDNCSSFKTGVRAHKFKAVYSVNQNCVQDKSVLFSVYAQMVCAEYSLPHVHDCYVRSCINR